MQPLYAIIARFSDCSTPNLDNIKQQQTLIINVSNNLSDLKKDYADMKQKNPFPNFEADAIEIQIARIAPITDFEVIKEPLVRVEYSLFSPTITKPKRKFKRLNRLLFPIDLDSEEAIQTAKYFVASWEEEAKEKDPNVTFKFIGFKFSNK